MKISFNELMFVVFTIFTLIACKNKYSDEHGIETDPDLANYTSHADSATYIKRLNTTTFLFYHNDTREYFKATRVSIEPILDSKIIHLEIQEKTETTLMSIAMSSQGNITTFGLNDFLFSVSKDTVIVKDPDGTLIKYRK
ncbi:hypothetical protein [Flectobacillus major]|uniref:hypothetical protein n=1 Tax=Flectobacillus major TaxID=103 RepID=UPI0005C694E9|nr:hypothetical protein [Flectobacillus major]